jgi:hypothetical protein
MLIAYGISRALADLHEKVKQWDATAPDSLNRRSLAIEVVDNGKAMAAAYNATGFGGSWRDIFCHAASVVINAEAVLAAN